ncbi:MAG: N-acetyl-gamma-glutamyl-phosphate reductase [Christensenellaceae bacterium]
MKKVFIDGKEGTTGLQIYDRLASRPDITLLTLPEEQRKDTAARKEKLNEADIVFLCLPDQAAKEAVCLIENETTKVIDASTAHRTAEGWAYGFPELDEAHRQAVCSAKRVANPGCHASGFIALVYPLVKAGLVSPDYPFVCHSVTGYSGGGKKMIAQYEAERTDPALNAPRQYGLGLMHKHLPEMTKVCALTRSPIFNPIVADYYGGMCGTVPVFADLMQKRMGKEELRAFFTEYYAGQNFISVAQEEESFLSANAFVGTNRMEIYVGGNDDRLLLAARFDNLGKGASGAAVQNMNLMLGLDERAYLE